MIQLHTVGLDGHKVFYRYRPGSSDVFLSFLHGYPTSSLDYHNLMAKIPSDYHVVAHDFLGFGKSGKPIDNSYSLTLQADLTCKLYEHLGARKIHIVAHDYGTSVTTELISRDNNQELEFDLQSISLCNGSMLIDMAQLRVIQRLLKHPWLGRWAAQLSSSYTFHRNMRNIWYDKSIYPKEEMQAHWDLLISGNGRRVLPRVTQYIDQRYANYDRWIGGLEKSNLPFHILWAENDPVAVVGMAHKLENLISTATLTLIERCGHYPMIEKEEVWLDHVLKFIQQD